MKHRQTSLDDTMLRFVPSLPNTNQLSSDDAMRLKFVMNGPMNAAADYPISLFIYSASVLFGYVSLKMSVFHSFSQLDVVILEFSRGSFIYLLVICLVVWIYLGFPFYSIRQ